jgi:beta-xylosidase
VKWEAGWPIFGIDGKAPATLNLRARQRAIPAIVAPDEFNRRRGQPPLPLVWQWNHNPDPRYWSVTERRGYLRLRAGRLDPDFLSARNTLTQRTFGPHCSGTVAMDVSQMKDGDTAGLGLLQRRYGFVGVRVADTARLLVMVSATSGAPEEVQSVPLSQPVVYLKVECDFKDRVDRASFLYSLDGRNWTAIGKPLPMAYTLPHFMGYRFALFNFATKSTGGWVDFDYFRVSPALTERL